jgi:hypothetical protein
MTADSEAPLPPYHLHVCRIEVTPGWSGSEFKGNQKLQKALRILPLT